ncbi:MAG: hypothetical protein ACOH2T_19175 [Pseudomonas sp.]
MKITRVSLLSGIARTMELNITQAQLDEFALPIHERRPIQDIFPDLTSDEREFLLTGCTPDEWDAMFGNTENEP